MAVAHLGLIALLALLTFTPSPVDGATRGHLNAGSLSQYLRPASQAEITRCEVAARSVDLDVLCPSVLPKGQYDDPWCEDTKESPCGYPCVFGACFLGQIVFTAPRSYVGMAPGSGHFVVWATTQGHRVVVPCLVGRKVGSIHNGDRKWDIWHCGTQPVNDPAIRHRGGREIIDAGEVMQGHTVFITTVKDTNVEVSLHGITALNRRLLVRITADMVQTWCQASDFRSTEGAPEPLAAMCRSASTPSKGG